VFALLVSFVSSVRVEVALVDVTVATAEPDADAVETSSVTVADMLRLCVRCAVQDAVAMRVAVLEALRESVPLTVCVIEGAREAETLEESVAFTVRVTEGVKEAEMAIDTERVRDDVRPVAVRSNEALMVKVSVTGRLAVATGNVNRRLAVWSTTIWTHWAK
jgi:hypothetical protein